MRGIDDPLIGHVAGHRQFVEFDIAEALCIDAETFGDGRFKIPGFDQIKIGDRAPQGTSAFDRNWAVWRWDPSQVPAYESLKHGDPAVIARKSKGLAKSLKTADACLAALEQAKPDLDPAACRFFPWKLDENRFLCEAQGEMSLADLKPRRTHHTEDGAEKAALNGEMKEHPGKLSGLDAAAGPQVDIVPWRGRNHILRRGEYLDIPRWILMFRKYAGID